MMSCDVFLFLNVFVLAFEFYCSQNVEVIEFMNNQFKQTEELLMLRKVMERQGKESNIDKYNKQISTVPENTRNERNDACELVLEDQRVYTRRMREIHEQNGKVIEIILHFKNSTTNLFDNLVEYYRPWFWIRVSGRYGKGLLLMRQSYKVLSLGTLSFGMDQIKTDVQMNPKDCLYYLNEDSKIELIRRLIFSGLILSEKDEPEGQFNEQVETKAEICTLRIKNDSKIAVFYNYCCRQDANGKQSCYELQRDIWLTTLIYGIRLVQLLVFLFIPLFVPESWYRSKVVAKRYLFNLKKPLFLRVRKTLVKKKNKFMVRLDGTDLNVTNALLFLPKFKNRFEKLTIDKEFIFKIKTLYLKLRAYRLVSRDNVPVGVARALYDAFFRCRIRESQGMNSCCHSNVLGPWVHFKNIVWYKFFQKLIRFLLLPLLFLPVFIRIYVFFAYEHNEYNSRLRLARSRNLNYDYEGTVTNLSPFDTLFLVSYAVVGLDIILVSLFGCLGHAAKEKTVYHIRKCFQEMRDSKTSRIEIGTKVLIFVLKPFTKFGIFALLFAWAFWILCLPFILIILMFYCFPLVNLTFRLIGRLMSSCLPSFAKTGKRFFKLVSVERSDDIVDNNTNGEPERSSTAPSIRHVLNTAYISLCLISLFSCVLVVMECTGFFVEVIIYCLIGIILNADETLKFVSLLLMIILYGRDCFNSVTNTYVQFNEVILKLIKEKALDDILEVTRHSADLQENTAFQINIYPFESLYNDDVNLILSDGVLKWKLNRTVLFIDKHDKPFITKKFFFAACNMKHSGCPGPVFPRLLSAFFHMVTITLFLVFVFFVLYLFGDDYMSSTNQTLVALATGILPLIFSKILFKPQVDASVDLDNLNFKNGFDNLIQNYSQSWPIYDIEYSACEQEKDLNLVDGKNGFSSDDRKGASGSGACMDDEIHFT